MEGSAQQAAMSAFLSRCSKKDTEKIFVFVASVLFGDKLFLTYV